MTACQRITDANTAGGTIVSTKQSTVFVNGILVATNGDAVSSHPTDHTSSVTANGSTTVFVTSVSVNRQGDADSCGHARAGGSSNVFIG
jgi:uncharacterized Zn-binding protein involved in type VI secretion